MHSEPKKYQTFPGEADAKNGTGLPPDLQGIAIQYVNKNWPSELPNDLPCFTKKIWLLAINSTKSCFELICPLSCHDACCSGAERREGSNTEERQIVCGYCLCIPLCCGIVAGSLAISATPITLLADGAIRSCHSCNNYRDNRNASFFFSMENPRKLEEYANTPIRQQMV